MSDEIIPIKNINGLSFKCKTCGLELIYKLDTQQSFINECPNCGVEWLPHQLNIESLRGLKSIFKILTNSQGAKLSFKFTRDKNE